MDTRPPDLSQWRGRTQELAQIQQWLTEPAVRLIGLTAAGGFGKSTLIAKVCEIVREVRDTDRFERVIWMSFNQAYDFWGWAAWLWETLTEQPLPPGTVQADLCPMLLQALGQRRYLLVLDNLETVLNAAGDWAAPGYGEWLRDYLEKGGRSVVLLTSREQPPLPSNLLLKCKWRRLGGLEIADGVALLRDDLGIGGSDVALAEFVRLADGHPLVLRLAAGWLRATYEDAAEIDYLKRREGNVFDLVGQHRGDAEACLGALLEFSVARLPEDLQALLVQIWVFPMPFNIVRINDSFQYRQVQVTEPQMRQLAKRSLLLEHCEAGIWTFQFQPLIRAFIQNRTLAHHRTTNDPWGEANCLKAMGDVLQFQKDMETALERYESAIRLFRGVGDKLGEANTLGSLGNFYFVQQDYGQALEFQRQRLAMMRQIGDRYSEAAALYYIGNTLARLDQKLQTVQAYEQARDIFQSIHLDDLVQLCQSAIDQA